MRCLVTLFMLISASAAAQYPNSSSQDAYAKGYKEGFREGYEQARKDAAGGAAPNGQTGKPRVFPIRVTSASYGTSSRQCDATRFAVSKANGKLSASVDASNKICGDPAPGERKSLDITYLCGDRAKTASAYEHRTTYLDCND